MKKVLLLILLFVSLAAFDSVAQCAMCQRVAQTNYANQDKAAKNSAMKRGQSLNNGILYLLSIPYLIGSVGAIVWWKNRRNNS